MFPCMFRAHFALQSTRTQDVMIFPSFSTQANTLRCLSTHRVDAYVQISDVSVDFLAVVSSRMVSRAGGNSR